jgi:hypothetical protein
MKYGLIVFSLFCGLARAEGPMIGLEFESERDNRSGMTNHAVTVIPGWEFSEKNLINRVELLIERNEDTGPDSSGAIAKENKLFLRVRHDGEFGDNFGYYIRGGAGRSFNNDRHYNFAYIEPGVEYKFAPKWAWTVAYREINAIDSMSGQHVGKLITGPSFDLSKNNEFEFRYVRGHGDKDLTSWLFEYVHRY